MRFTCKIYHDNNIILHDKEYNNLREISEDLGLTYQQIADLSSRKTIQQYRKFKYFPNIEIVKIIEPKKNKIKNNNIDIENACS